MRNYAFILVAIFAVIASPVLALIAQPKPQAGDLALVVALPWGKPIAQILRDAQATEVFVDRAPLGAFVTLQNPESYRRMQANGAWLVLNGNIVLELC